MQRYVPGRRQLTVGGVSAGARFAYNNRRALSKSASNAYNKLKSYMANNRAKRDAKVSNSRLRGAKSAPVSRGSQIPLAGDTSMSSYRSSRKATSKVVKLSKEMPISTIINNSTGRKESVIGQQAYELIGDYYTDTDVNLAFTLIIGNAAGANQGSKIVLESVHSETMMRNQENIACRMTIYDVICRKDTDATVTDPVTAIASAYNDIGSGASTDPNILGGSPFSLPRFTEYFKVHQTTDIILGPGATHIHKVHYAPNRLISKIITNRIAGSGIGGVTMYTFIRFHGTPLNDITTQTQVSIAPIAIDWVNSEEYKFKAISISQPFTDVNDTMPTSFGVAGAVMQDDGNELPLNEA